jgi:iron complex outermembrane recepter protein
MRKAALLLVGSLMAVESPLWAAEDFMQFYKEEAKVVSASLQPQPANQTPATVYVVSQQDIKDSGALNLWDALRSVPGVDVMSTRTGQGEVSIRGLNRPFNNRVLVLLDGKSVLNGYFDNVTWESLQVQIDEIDRIEIVEGPASAVYGANAVAGVINIITKSPEQLQGGKLSYTAGERSTQLGSFVYGKKQSQLGYKLGGGWRSTNRFENADGLASEAGEFNSLISYDFSDHSGMSVSGGVNNYNTLSSLGVFGPINDKGISSYGRADYHYEGTRARTSWDRGRTVAQTALLQGSLDYDNYDAEVDQSVSLPMRNAATFGASYHRDSARSVVLADGRVHQDLWAAFFEDKWEIAERWMLMASGRVDRHPLTPIRFSPRGSLLYTPVPEQVFRVSAGTSFRNPTLVENYLDTTISTPNPGTISPLLPPTIFPTVESRVVGTRTLTPESMKSVEISHTGRFQRLRTTLTGFYYTYQNTIDIGVQQLGIPIPPNIPVTTSFANSSDSLHARGGELSVEYFLSAALRVFGNYSYQYINSDNHTPYPSQQYPRHKANTGIRTNHRGWTTSWIVHWVDSTVAPISNGSGSGIGTGVAPVNAYFLVDAHVGYAFSGAWSGLELGVNAFNLLNHDHYETLPIQPTGPGQAGELIRSRLSATASYKF